MPLGDAEFASLVAKTSADHSELEAGMRRGETIVKQSGDKMQASLNQVGASSDVLRSKNEQLTRGFAAVGAAGTLAGSQFGGVASGAAGLTGAMAALGIAIGPVTLALAAAVAIGAQFVSKAREAAEATEGWEERYKELGLKTNALTRETQVLRGEMTELEAVLERARDETLGMEPGRGREVIRRALVDQFKAEQELTKEKERQAVAVAEVATQRTKDAAALAKSVQQEKTIADLIFQIDVERGVRGPFDKQDARERHLREVLALEKQIKAEKAEAESLEVAQIARTKALAGQLAVAAGLIKATDLIGDPTERRLAELLAGITGGVAAPGTPGGFSIGARPAEQFRFGAPRPGGETIGPQNEQAKTTAEVKQVNVNLEEAIRLIREASPDILSTMGNTTGGMMP